MNQKTFNLTKQQEFTFSTYVCPTNQPNLLHPIYNFLTSKNNEVGNIVYLWGDEGSGKSHILQSITNYTSKIGHKVFYSCLKNHSVIKPDIFESLESFNIICLDDIDTILPLAIWQEAFYYCLELAENNNTKLIVSSSDNINQITTARAETYSRLAASFRYQLPNLNENEIFQALKLRAKYRQIPIGDDVLEYIKNHAARDTKSIFTLFDRLAENSLTLKKTISKKMVKEALSNN